MHAHKIYDLTVVHLFKCIFKLGPRSVNMLQAPRYLNPALAVEHVYSHIKHDDQLCLYIDMHNQLYCYFKK